MRHADKFFAYARARQQIYLDRAAGKPWPWTRDKTLQRYPFCCVFREDDRTTRWFREHVRTRYQDRPEVMLATVVFRMFNRIATGEAIFSQTMLPSSRFKTNETTAFDIFAATGDPGILRSAVLALLPKGPYVTGSYIISTPPGYEKMEGVLEILARFWRNGYSAPTHGEFPRSLSWRDIGARCLDNQSYSLEMMWNWLSQHDYLGKFHSYEIVTDLRHTPLLDRAPDIMTWTSPGPGARRGANRVLGLHYKDKSLSRQELIEKMRELLSLSRDSRVWPGRLPTPDNKKGEQAARGWYSREEWPTWEMRDVEHTLCEFDKYERLRLGQGRSKRLFRRTT